MRLIIVDIINSSNSSSTFLAAPATTQVVVALSACRVVGSPVSKIGVAYVGFGRNQVCGISVLSGRDAIGGFLCIGSDISPYSQWTFDERSPSNIV